MGRGKETEIALKSTNYPSSHMFDWLKVFFFSFFFLPVCVCILLLNVRLPPTQLATSIKFYSVFDYYKLRVERKR